MDFVNRKELIQEGLATVQSHVTALNYYRSSA